MKFKKDGTVYELRSPAEARVVTVQADGLPDGKRVAVPHRGTSCYEAFNFKVLNLTFRLLSPTGARVIATIVQTQVNTQTSCCPSKGFIYCHYSTRLTPNQLILRILCHAVCNP